MGGSPWALVAVLGFALWKKDRAHTDTHENRVKDAQQVSGTLVEMQRANLTTTQNLSTALAAQTHAINTLNESVRDLHDAVERLRDRLGGPR